MLFRRPEDVVHSSSGRFATGGGHHDSAPEDTGDHVQHYAPSFSRLFTAAAFAHFQRYTSGPTLCEDKTTEAINRRFVQDLHTSRA
jgi:hypothetical protein